MERPQYNRRVIASQSLASFWFYRMPAGNNCNARLATETRRHRENLTSGLRGSVADSIEKYEAPAYQFVLGYFAKPSQPPPTLRLREKNESTRSSYWLPANRWKLTCPAPVTTQSSFGCGAMSNMRFDSARGVRVSSLPAIRSTGQRTAAMPRIGRNSAGSNPRRGLIWSVKSGAAYRPSDPKRSTRRSATASSKVAYTTSSTSASTSKGRGPTNAAAPPGELPIAPTRAEGIKSLNSKRAMTQ